MLADLSESELWDYRSDQVEPSDFDEFWALTLAEARKHPSAIELVPTATGLATVDVFDVSFAGFGGERVSAWLKLPVGRSGPLPLVVQFPGYGSGRGHALRDLLWSAAGYAHLSVDVRGQGSAGVQGFLTDGIQSEYEYYYRRAYTDGARAIDAARGLDTVDPSRIVIAGQSQGGGLAIAAAALVPDVAALVVQAPFLSDFRRATQVTGTQPYDELRGYLAARRDLAERAHRTLSYMDAVVFASRAVAPALFSTGLMDDIAPPSTVFGAFHAYAGPKRMVTWPYNGHEAGGQLDDEAALAFVADVCSTDSTHRPNPFNTKRTK
jgi:cephalosporin-C deacetylase